MSGSGKADADAFSHLELTYTILTFFKIQFR